jgi:hypothetical protein
MSKLRQPIGLFTQALAAYGGFSLAATIADRRAPIERGIDNLQEAKGKTIDSHIEFMRQWNQTKYSYAPELGQRLEELEVRAKQKQDQSPSCPPLVLVKQAVKEMKAAYKEDGTDRKIMDSLGQTLDIMKNLDRLR